MEDPKTKETEANNNNEVKQPPQVNNIFRFFKNFKRDFLGPLNCWE